MRNNSNNLKPCPLCGDEVFLERWTKNGLEIKCKRCLIMMRQKVLTFDLRWLAKQMTEIWNTRVSKENEK